MPRPSVWWGDNRVATKGAWVVALLICGSASIAMAGGTEFPADGTRGLGRGGSGMARADDPTVLMRNPALLADLWGDQALIGAHLLLPDACFRGTGAVASGSQEIIDLGDGPVATQEWFGEPIPELCYSGPEPFLPAIAFTTKLRDDLGIGIGFMPPEIASLSQWGNRDGTMDTEGGKRPNPLRYLGSHLNVTYFSLLGGIGYRPYDWIRVGLGFQWAMVAASGTNFATASQRRKLSSDVRVDVFARDLFIPGVFASVHLVPMDAIDIALGFKWSDRIAAKAKLDLTAAPFGVDYYDTSVVDEAGNPVVPTSSTRNVPTTTAGQSGEVNAPPIWVPQLSGSVRYAYRLRPRVRTGDWDSVRAEGEPGAVEDHMSSELFDVEFSFIYVMNSLYDRSVFYGSTASSQVAVRELLADGTPGPESTFNVGLCTNEVPGENVCLRSESPTEFGGIDQISLRLGGDYNLIPGLFSVRMGVSYESDGQERGYMNPRYYMFQRVGLHGGFTVRVKGRTDITFAYAHFFQDEIRTQYNESSGDNLQSKYETAEYNYAPGEHDGLALVEIPYGSQQEPGPRFANAGTLSYSLDVVSVAITQHF